MNEPSDPSTSDQRALGLYVHIPFCEKKCPYCDFNTFAGLEDRFTPMVSALCDEMMGWHSRLGRRPVRTIFLGGGTPTVLDHGQLTQLFTTIQKCFILTDGCEITCEANPGTVDRAKFAHLYQLGVNRLSIGVQSFQPMELRFLGRIHDADDARRAFERARAAGFANVNLDFIFGLPDQTPEVWRRTLQCALELDPEHLSLYSLIVEPNTPLDQWIRSGRVAAPDEDVAAVLYELALNELAMAGYAQYEISNWARADSARSSMPEHASRHNLLYWRNQEYLGIGPGAHSHIQWTDDRGNIVERRWGNRKSVPGYIRRIATGEPIEEFSETITPRLSMGETMMLGLRLVQEGVERAAFAQRYGADVTVVYDAQLARLQRAGLLHVDPMRVRLTRHGMMMGNQVFLQFLPDDAELGNIDPRSKQ